MKVRFWGTRGSIPSPAKDGTEFGGNTACVEVLLKNGASLILDAGTGIRPLGLDYLSRAGAPRTVHIFISHAHWDHIQGLPFFVPMFLADFTINFYCHLDMEFLLERLMSPPFFPITHKQLASKLVYHKLDGNPIEVEGSKVSFLSLKHPQEVYGIRIDDGDASVVYSSDTEHDEAGTDEALVKFSHDAGALLYDAQYTPDEYRKGRMGWGHSTFEAAIGITRRAGVKKLVLIHHEPAHNDEALRAIEESARKIYPDTISAREGSILDI